jgi:hypothetical protein
VISASRMRVLLADLGARPEAKPAQTPVEVRNGAALERRRFEREAATDPVKALLKKEGVRT